jgi:hypothetical protein
MHWIDPGSLNPVKSRVERFLFNPRGQADGMILANGTEAHFPPRNAKKKTRGKKHHGRHDDRDTRPVEIADTVERILHGAKGEVPGVLLKGGEIVRFPPHAAHATPEMFWPGSPLAVRGAALQIEGTTVIEATEIGRSKRAMRRIPEAS